MQEATCNHCGASVIFSAKFCRQCGNRLDESEMTTRSLDAPTTEPPSFEHPTRPAGGAPTSPTYSMPVMTPAFYDQPPYHTPPPSNNRTALFVILGLVMAVLIGAGIVGFIVLGRFSHRPVTPPPPPVPTSSSPQTDTGINIPHLTVPNPPPMPSEPPPPGRGSVKTSLDASLRYPGAEVVMEVNSGDGAVTQLHTTDDIDKVTDWYVEKINPKKHVRIPGGSILDGDNIKVLLTSGGDETSIQVIRKTGD